jgi:hypothetical protein
MVFTDGGSTFSLIRNEFANRLGLEGTYLEYYLRVVGHAYARKESKMYTFTLVDRQGYEHTVRAVGINSISDTGPAPDMTPIQALFPGFPVATFRRPQGEVDVLLGMNNRRLHPNGVKDVENLRMMKSRLGPAYLITGSHPALTHTASSILPEARDLSAAVLTLPPGACSCLSERRSLASAQDQHKEDLGGEQVLANGSEPIQGWLPPAKGGETPTNRTNERTPKLDSAAMAGNKRTIQVHQLPAVKLDSAAMAGNKRTIHVLQLR